VIVLPGMDLRQTLVDLLARGAYIPALAVALVLAIHALRRRGVDVTLANLLGHGDPGAVRTLRPWLPLGMAAVAFLLASGSGAMGVAQAAAESLAAAILAMAGHNTGQAVLALRGAPDGGLQPPSATPPGDDEPDPPADQPRQKPALGSIRRRLHVAERVVVAVGAVVLGCLGGGGCIDDLGGGPHPAAGVEIVVEKDFRGRTLAPGDAIYLHELPVAAGFLEVKYSRLYRGPLFGAAAEEYGATELMGGNVVGVSAREHIDAITGIIFGEIQIANTGRLYEALWWMLFAGVDYPAVLFDPLPGQPTPPSGMPITTFLLVCNTDEPDARTCRSWPGAVDAGMAVCRDKYTKVPISKAKCKILAPYTQWWVLGTPPGGGYPVAMATKTRHEQLVEHFAEEAREALESMTPEERREAGEYAESLRQDAADPAKRWDYAEQ
jgi:hypothetical protein